MKSSIAFFICIAALLPSAASAQVVISEIMYDLESGSDSGREWVEVFNSGASSVNLTEWKLFENSVNHSLSAYSGGETLPSGGYAIIADNPANFLADNPGFSGALFDSAFSLSNTGETLIMRCCGSDLVDIDSVTYASTMGGAGDGKTLQRSSTNGSFSALSPTPGSGTLNADTSSGGNETILSEPDDTSPNSGAGGGPLAGAKPPPPAPLLYANAGSDIVGVSGAPIMFVGSAYDSKKAVVEDAHFAWNFGDGSFAEGASVEHVYAYPGKYAVVLTVTKHERTDTDERIVTIEEPRVSLSVFEDGSVSIANATGRMLDVSSWRVVEDAHVFTLPKNTSVLPNASLRIPSKRLQFFASNRVALQFPDGEVAARVEEKKEILVEEDPPARTIARYASVQAPTTQKEEEPRDVPKESATGTAQVASAALVEDSLISSPWLWAAIFLGVVGAGFTVFIRRLEAGEWTIIEETDEKSV